MNRKSHIYLAAITLRINSESFTWRKRKLAGAGTRGSCSSR